MRNVFIATRNVAEFQQAMKVLADTDKGQPGLAVVQGKAGMGKTVSAQTWHAQHDGESVYLRVWEDWTQTAMLQQLCFEVCEERPRSAAGCKARIIQALNAMREENKRPMIFIDEADRLQVSRIEDLRDIHDMTGAPVVMIGEEHLYTRLSGRSRILDRVTQKVVFKPVVASDILLFASEAAGLKLSPEACKQLLGSCGGNFRRLYVLTQAIEQACRAHGSKDVDAELVKRVARERFQ